MGLVSMRWETNVDGHPVVVSRNEFTRVLTLSWDGAEIATKQTLIGTGQFGTVAPGGAKVHVRVNLGGKCGLTVDGKPVMIPKVH